MARLALSAAASMKPSMLEYRQLMAAWHGPLSPGLPKQPLPSAGHVPPFQLQLNAVEKVAM